MKIIVNNKEVDTNTIELDGIDMRDYPDFCDAYIISAEFKDGTSLTDEEIESIGAENVQELVHESLT